MNAETKAGIDILVVDDEHTLAESCASVLGGEGYNVVVVRRGDEARELVQRRAFDIVLLDLYMSQVSGMELLRHCLGPHPDTLVIIMTGNPSVSTSLEALRAGAWDYLPKPFAAQHLQILIGRAAHTVLVARETRAQRERLEKEHGAGDGIPVLGRSPRFRRVVQLAQKVAATDASVFITGESGTGKELIAQYIHRWSRRSSRPLVAVNCAALPETLLESEMFGHYKGAFTGAIRDKPGLLETANGGTLFLDELTEMPISIQAKLLRVIQDGVVRRVGSNTTDAIVNVRFIAATNRDPQEALEAGALRKDLFFRLRVVPIHMPALRERLEDIPLLAQCFLEQYWSRHRGAGSPPPRLGEEAIQALRARRWAGNVRELQNVIEHAVVFAEPGTELLPSNIAFPDDAVLEGAPERIATPALANEVYHEARERVLSDFERRYLVSLVERADGNMSRAARIARMDRTTLYRLMDKHSLQRDTLIRPGERWSRED